MSDSPSDKPFVTDGRDGRGRFSAGNPGGPGNPAIGQLSKHRAAFIKAAKSSDIRLALDTLRSAMKDGRDADRIRAAEIILNRYLGTVAPAELLERIEALEAQLLAKPNGRGGTCN